MITLHPVDTAIIMLYFFGILALGFWVAKGESKKEQGAADFFVAGKSLGWFAIGSSLFATNISSEHLIGLATDGFRTGLAVGNYEWAASLVLLFLAGIFVPFYIGSNIRTMPEFLEMRFGVGARVYLSIVTIVANVLVRVSASLFAGAVVLQQLFAFDFWTCIFVLSVTTVLYTAAGGLKAVVYTDAAQMVIMLVGAIALTAIGLYRVGGWSELVAQLPAAHFDMVRPASDPEMPWTGLVLGVPILGIWYWCTDQVIVQRVLGAKNLTHARYGVIFAGFLKILPVFIFVLPGLCGRILFPNADPKSIFPIMVKELLPPGLVGLVASALMAALMSSLSSTLNSTAALVSLDFFERFGTSISQRRLVWIGRLSTLIVMGFGIAWVPMVMRAESLFQYLQQINAAISPPITAVFLFGVFWRRANHPGVLTALFGGLLTGITLVITNRWPFLLSAGITFGVSCFLIVMVSLLTKPPSKKHLEGMTWLSVRQITRSLSTAKEQKRYRILACILAVTMAALWIKFW